jgi:hypothetical protein
MAEEKPQQPRETVVRVTSDDKKKQVPRFVEPRPRGSSCCPGR